VKVKFDENVSTRIVQAIRVLESDRDIEIGSVLEDYGHGIADPEWMFRFRDEGGTAMISGDHNILRDPVNIAAYSASGLTSIWPPSGFPELKRFGQAAFLVRWWPLIKEKIASSPVGSRWRIPLGWTPGIEKFIELRDPRLGGN
jgi:PIN like domain